MKKFCFFLALMVGLALHAQEPEPLSDADVDSIENAKRLENACSQITIEKDKFTGKITKRSPEISHVNFTRSSGKVFISLNCNNVYLSANPKGVIILLANGKKINKPAKKIDVDAESGYYSYWAFIELTANDIKAILSSQITDYRLDIFDHEVLRDFDQKLLNEYLKCLNKS